MFPQPITRILNDPVFRSIVYVPPADLQLPSHHRWGLVPGPASEIIPDSGHLVPIDEPVKLARAIRDFVTELRA
jgi:pimeloyl-ACP methyl ester carboxylesterase